MNRLNTSLTLVAVLLLAACGGETEWVIVFHERSQAGRTDLVATLISNRKALINRIRSAPR